MRAVFFDIGETLIDETRVWSLFSDWLGVPRLTMFGLLGDVIANGRDHQEVFRILRPDTDSKTLIERFRSEVDTGYVAADLYPDAVECLDALKQHGYFVGIAGNQPVRSEKDLAAMGLPVDLIASSDGWGVKKPTRAFFERIIRESRCPPEEIVYVGDRVDNDVIPAADAGMAAIHIIRGAWGYLQRNAAGVKRARAQIRSLDELPMTVAFL